MRLSRMQTILQVGEDNILRDLQNFSYPTKAEFNNCFIIHSKYFRKWPLLLTNLHRQISKPTGSYFRANKNNTISPQFFFFRSTVK